MASPFDDGWLLSEPLELLQVEVQMNDPRRERIAGGPLFTIVTNPRGGRVMIYASGRAPVAGGNGETS